MKIKWRRRGVTMIVPADEDTSPPGVKFIVRCGPHDGAHLFVGPFDTSIAALDWQEQNWSTPGTVYGVYGVSSPEHFAKHADS